MTDKENIRQIRRRVLKMSSEAKSAHAGSALSCVEILYAAFSCREKRQPAIDRVLLSKGHAAMALYATLAHFGKIPEVAIDEYMKNGTSLWGHPSAASGYPGIDWSTGSLGHGLAVAAGFAYHGKFIQPATALSLAVLSDGECDEGSVWEAALFSGHHKLGNLMAFVDYNKIQSFGTCDEVLALEPFADKWKSFAWNVVEGDGHDVTFLTETIRRAVHSSAPTCVIAHTVKGKGVPGFENTLLSHYRPVSKEQLESFDHEK